MFDKIFDKLGKEYENEKNMLKQGKIRQLYFEMAKKKIDFDSKSFFLYGLICFILEKYEEAIKYLTKNIENNNFLDLDIIYEIIGLAYYKLLNNLEATRYFIMSIEKNPNNDTSKYNLGIIYLKNKNFKKSIEIFKELQNKNPNDENIKNIIKYIEPKFGK